MNQTKLSICIATRNRGAFIGATLESIICQATDEVEIVVLDGASSDNTEDVIRLHQDRFPRLRYFRQETNSGIDRDFAKAVDLAQGEYCWLFCDDDIFKAHAIRVVLEATKGDYSVIVAESEIRNADLSQLLQPRRTRLETNRVYRRNENDLLMAEVGDYLSFIGGVIIKRQLWAARNKDRYFGSCFIHMGVIFQEPLPGEALLIAEPLIAIRYGNASWLGKSFEIFMFNWPALIWSFVDLSDSAKSQVCSKEPWRSFKTLLHFRAKGAYTKKQFTELLEPRLESSGARFVSNAIAHFPGRTANLLAYVYYSIFRRPPSRRLILSDLTNSPFCFWRLPARFRTQPVGSSPTVLPGSRVPSSISNGSDGR